MVKLFKIISSIFGTIEEKGAKEDHAPQSEIKPEEFSYTVSFSPSSFDKAAPPLQGDYAKAVFLWLFDKAAPMRNTNTYPGYILYECGIRDTVSYHKQLIAEGYLEEAPAAAALQTLKVTDLKEILRELALPVSGKKDILVQRIVDSGETAVLKKYLPEKLYILSDSGRSFLQDHSAYVYLHRKSTLGINYKEYDAKHVEGESFHDTVRRILVARTTQGSPAQVRSAYLELFYLLSETDDLRSALDALLRVVYFDCRGEDIHWAMQYYRDKVYTKTDLQERINCYCPLNPTFMKDITKYSEVFEESMIGRIYAENPFADACSKALFSEAIHAALDGRFEDTAVSLKKRIVQEHMNSL